MLTKTSDTSSSSDGGEPMHLDTSSSSIESMPKDDEAMAEVADEKESMEVDEEEEYYTGDEDEKKKETMDVELDDADIILARLVSMTEQAKTTGDINDGILMAIDDNSAKVKRLWSSFKQALQETRPAPADEPSVDDIIQSVDEMIELEPMATSKEIHTKLLGLLKKIRPVDLDSLCDLLKKHNNAGKFMEDKHVLLMLGGTGAGKTTTILFLAGAKFKKEFVDGVEHLKPVEYPDPKLEEFRTSGGATSVTRFVRCFEIMVDGVADEPVVLCDVPGFGDTAGTEVDIANGFGIVRAIRRAKSVKPILVLSKDGIGDRCSGVAETLDTITRLLEGDITPDYMKAFSYLFTKFPPQHKSQLHKRFRKAAANLEASVHSFVEDIATKTNPEANIILPVDDDGESPQSLLSSLCSREATLDPKTAFSEFVSEKANYQLQLQLQCEESCFRQLLQQAKCAAASRRLQRLKFLADLLAEATKSYQRSYELAAQFLDERREKVSSCTRRFQNVVEHVTFVEDLATLEGVIDDLANMESFRVECLSQEPSANDLYDDVLDQVISGVGKRLFGADCSMPMDKMLGQLDDCVLELRRLNEVHRAFPESDEVERGYIRGADQYAAVANRLLQEAQACLPSLAGNIQTFQTMNNAFKRLRGHFDLLGQDSDRVKSLEHRYEELVQNLQQALSSASNDIATQTRSLEDGVKLLLDGDEPSCLPPLSLSHLKKSYDLLGAFSSGHFHGNVTRRGRDNQQAMSLLDSTLIESFRLILEHCTVSLGDTRLAVEGGGQLVEANDKLGRQHELLSYMDHNFRDLRTWSATVGLEVAPLLDNLCAYQHALHEYGAKLKTMIDEEMKEMASISSLANAFLRRLQSETNNTAALLDELSQDNCWPLWDAKRKERIEILRNTKAKKEGTKNKSFLRSVGSFFGFGGGSNDPSQHQNAEAADFEKTLAEIIVILQGRIDEATKNICDIQWRSLDSLQLFHAFFLQANPSTVLVLRLLRLQQKNAPLTALILNSSTERNKMVATEVAMTRALVYISDKCREALAGLLFVDVERLLVVLRESPEAIKSFRSMLQIDGFQSPENGQNRRNAFIQSIKACPDYESFRREAIGEALKIERLFVSLSITDERRVKSANEFDRFLFYRGLLAQLDATTKVACLSVHASDEATHVKLQSMWDNAIPLLVRETQKIGDEVGRLLAMFPDAVSDFSSLNIWLGNLATICSVFSEEAPAVSERASALRREAECKKSEVLDKLSREPPVDLEELIQQLIRMKRASVKVGCWQTEINRCIDKLLTRASTVAPNAGRFILDLSVKLKKVDGEDAAVAQQILSEHECFGGAMNAIFNAATARQGIEYVIRSLNLSPAQSVQLNGMYGNFSREYSSIIKDGLTAVLADDLAGQEDCLRGLAEKASFVASDFTLDYESQLVSLSAFLFAYWSLKSTNNFVRQHQSERNFLTGEDSMNFLRKPHAAQAVAVWILLNYPESRTQVLRSHMCELKTGEGKSIVLGVTATVVALMGGDVDCVCYSSYLSNRDFSDFKAMFQHFGVDKYIRYSSIEDLCGQTFCVENEVRRLSEDVLKNKPVREKSDSANSTTRVKVLLVDEVDVLFKDDFFGKTYNPIVNMRGTHVSDFLNYIWDYHCKDTFSFSTLLSAETTRRLLTAFPSDVRPLIEYEIQQMLIGAKAVSSNTNQKYSVVNDRIAYKDLDGVTTSSFNGYETNFAYMKERTEGRILTSANDSSYYSIIPACGRFSYAELPTGYDAILGVTGTLSGLGDLKMGILKETYNIRDFSYVPSVYGANKLKFAGDCPRDVLLCDSASDHFLELRSEVDRRRKPLNGVNGVLRPVMVFFRSRDDMEAFYTSEQMDDLRETNTVRMITEEIDPSEKEAAFLKATESGAATLMIREYGRGTDFKCFDTKVLQAGGVHVIQGFFSTDNAEEVQLKGRTARQGAEGSYSMVLNVKDLKHDLDVTSSDVKTMKLESKFYSLLDKRRATKAQEKLDSVLKDVENAETMHYRSLAFVKAARNGRREEALDFLFECNFVTGRQRESFVGNNVKQKFLAERAERLKAHYSHQEARRLSAEESAPSSKSPSILLLEDQDTTHYGVLGVTRGATKADVNRAFHQLAKIHHPDKSSHENATAIFLRIKEAKNVLMDDAKRSAYDRELQSRAGLNDRRESF